MLLYNCHCFQIMSCLRRGASPTKPPVFSTKTESPRQTTSLDHFTWDLGFSFMTGIRVYAQKTFTEHLKCLGWGDLKVFLLSNICFYLFIWLCWVFVSASRIFSCGMQDLVPWPGIKPRPPAFGLYSLSHWTTREVPQGFSTWCPHANERWSQRQWIQAQMPGSLASCPQLWPLCHAVGCSGRQINKPYLSFKEPRESPRAPSPGSSPPRSSEVIWPQVACGFLSPHTSQTRPESQAAWDEGWPFREQFAQKALLCQQKQPSGLPEAALFCSLSPRGRKTTSGREEGDRGSDPPNQTLGSALPGPLLRASFVRTGLSVEGRRGVSRGWKQCHPLWQRELDAWPD